MFQEELCVHYIKYRPIKPRSPHLNGKVERSQHTDKTEFYSTIPKAEKNIGLAQKLLEWENFYNKQRPHSSLKGKTPYEKFLEVQDVTPIQPEVTLKYWENRLKIFQEILQHIIIEKRIELFQMS